MRLDEYCEGCRYLIPGIMGINPTIEGIQVFVCTINKDEPEIVWDPKNRIACREKEGILLKLRFSIDK